MMLRWILGWMLGLQRRGCGAVEKRKKVWKGLERFGKERKGKERKGEEREKRDKEG